MNERINELKSQCIFRETRGTDAFNSYVVDRFDTEKFAELIVRECARINFSNIVGIDPEDDAAVGRAIKKHFGVEE